MSKALYEGVRKLLTRQEQKLQFQGKTRGEASVRSCQSTIIMHSRPERDIRTPYQLLYGVYWDRIQVLAVQHPNGKPDCPVAHARRAHSYIVSAAHPCDPSGQAATATHIAVRDMGSTRNHFFP